MPPPASPAHGPYAVFRFASFRWFVVSLLAMVMTAQIQLVVVGWEIYRQTQDPLAIGLLGLSEVLPYLAVALYAGHVVDRHDRRLVSLAALSVLLVAAFALFVMALRDPGATGVWPFYVVFGACGVARSFLQVARSALVAEVVPRTLYPNAATWRSSTWQAGMVAGPALGGVLFASLGVRWTLGINLAISIVASGAMLRVRHQPTPVSPVPVPIIRNLVDGLRYVRKQRVILGALTLDLLAVFFGGVVAILPIFASDILHVGADGFGVLQAAPGAGAVLMAFVLAHRRPFRHAGPVLLAAVTTFGICILGFALSRSFALSVLLLAISGAADNVSAVIRATLIQVQVPPEMLGRVSSVNAMFIGSSNELGYFESGVAARLVGAVPSALFGATMTLLTVAVIAWRVPDVRKLGVIQRE
ncbi:MAG TPA: MFS transporter [Gemmatimonadaceae bacterium]